MVFTKRVVKGSAASIPEPTVRPPESEGLGSVQSTEKTVTGASNPFSSRSPRGMNAAASSKFGHRPRIVPVTSMLLISAPAHSRAAHWTTLPK